MDLKPSLKLKSQFLLCLFLIQICGVVLFLKGYLLTRVVITDSAPICDHDINAPKCFPRSFKRVVWLLVDALRYDFMLYNSSLESSNFVPFYINKMTNMRDFLKQKPRNTKLFRFIADPPTTTMQRLKALTTGTLPTFIDISSNFNSYEVQEDNIIRQCKRHGLNVTFLGDDTWIGMYHNMFDRSYPFPSLNVKDLDTVDKGVFNYILPELREHNADLVIGHFLGVDHCGHTYGPNNNIMKEKLVYIDNVIKSVFDTVDNETIVFVFGDHGMTSTGDHGGETEDETVAALLVYTPQPIFDINKINGRSIYQTDLVPTVSLLLGLPIPFSSLGMIIPELFQQTSLSYINPKTFYLTALRRNCYQLNAFITAQSRLSNDISMEKVAMLQEMYNKLEMKFKSLNYNSTKLESLYELYMRKVREVCVSTWAQFDVSLMAIGILILIAHLLFIIQILNKGGSLKLFILEINWIDLISFLICIFHSVALFSNSLIVYEGVMVNFFIQTLMLILLLTKLKESALSLCTDNQSWWKLYRQLIETSLPFIIVMISVRITHYFHTCRDQQDDCLIPQLLQKQLYDNDGFYEMILYFSQFIISNLTFVFAIFYGEHFIDKTFGKEYRQFLLSKWSRRLIRCSLVFIFCSGVFLSDIVSVWMFWIYILGTVVAIVLAVTSPFHSENIIALKTHWTLAPYSWLLLLLWVVVCLLVKCTNQVLLIPLSLSVIQLILTVQIMWKMPQVSLFTKAIICSLFSYQFFFGFGHHATVTSLRFEAAFVGIYGDLTSFTLPIAGILVGINTLASQILFTCAVPLFSLSLKEQSSSSQLFYIFIGSLKLLCTVLAAMILRRHLMVWAVFGPRFMYEASFQCLTNVLCIMSLKLVSYYKRLINKNTKMYLEKDI